MDLVGNDVDTLHEDVDTLHEERIHLVGFSFIRVIDKKIERNVISAIYILMYNLKYLLHKLVFRPYI